MKICPSCLERFPQEADTCPRDGTELKDIQARSDDELVGRVLEGRWVIEELIGRGGMGTVYKGEQRSVDRTVAIKVLRTDLSYKEESVERFFREANLAANINNPNCVTIFDFGQSSDGEILYLAMEYLEGESLLARSRRQPLTYDELCVAAGQICSALMAFHDEDVIHRDLKPENIFLVDEEKNGADNGGDELFVKVFDFGIAKSLEEESRSVTQTGDVIGTPPFMSPEQCSGEPLDPRSDLYSLGCILFEQLSGRVPFTGDTAVDLLISHAHRTPPRLETLQPDVPRPFVELVHDLLSKHPGQRPDSADDVRKRLEEIRLDLDDTLRAQPTVGSRSGDTATQRAIDSDKQTRSLTSQDYETIAELGYVPDDVDPEETFQGRASRLLPVWMVTALMVLAGGGAWGWYAGWFSKSGPGEKPQQPSLASVGAESTDSGTEPPGDAGVGADIPDGGGDVDPSVQKTLEALRKAQRHARAESNDQTGSNEKSDQQAEEKTEQTGASSQDDAANPGSSDQQDEKAGGPLAKFPLLTSESASAIFDKHTPEVLACFKKHLGQTPAADGSVKVQVIVGADGGVNSASIKGGSVTSTKVRKCVRERAETWKFPPTKSGSPVAIQHIYGFEFSWK